MSWGKNTTPPRANNGSQPAASTTVSCPADRSKTKEAIQKIKDSDFGKTEEGKKVVTKIEDLEKNGKIGFKSLGSDTRGEWNGKEIVVNKSYEGDADAIASELVHEATHALHEDEFPGSKSKVTIDEEMRTNENQLALYESQRKDGFRDPELERRRKANADGKLRDDVRSRYPGTPEHL